jgi:peptide/nickel transport system substrate-binding protein
VATWAEAPGAQPDWILPFVDAPHNEVSNTIQFQQLMYRPLYWVGVGSQPTLNDSLSLAQEPVYTGDKAVLNLKDYSWSDGEHLTPADVMFFINMDKAERHNFAWYVPGEFPDNVTSAQITGPAQVTLTLDAAYAHTWFTDNQLFEITPFPMAWDKTSDSAPPGSGGCSTDESRCAAVYNYLLAKNKDAADYASSPLWSVADGPWKLASYSTDGAADFVPNKTYSGPVKPTLSGFDELPFTSPEALYNAQLGGRSVNVGQVPTSNLPKRDPNSASLVPATSALSKNYTLAPLQVWGWSYSIVNYANPTLGAAFRQLYVRQALQETIDQVTDATVAWRGYAVATSGPVPAAPSTSYLAPVQRENGGQGPYAFNPAHARNVLLGHGWTEQDGVMTCTGPGTAADQCGTGVVAGTKLTISVDYSTGATSASEEMQQWKSDASKAGIDLELDGQPFNAVIGNTTTCKQTPSTCGWQIGYWGDYVYSGVPVGSAFFLPDSVANYSDYVDPTMSALVDATLRDDSAGAFHSYETYAAQQLPGAINMPNSYKVYAISTDLGGVTPISSQGRILPENWYFTK